MLSHVYNDLALCHFLLREHDAAVDAARKAVEINRGNVADDSVSWQLWLN